MPVPSKAAAYRALESHDSRFDGLLFVAVKSTGIYCRPVCPARTPKLANCEFFSSAAAAQDAGYRPCLRCRPETAPHLAAWKGTSNTISRAMMLISEGALDAEESTVDGLAARVGIGERQLRRLFLQHLGTSPLSVAQTRRVLFAKQLIHDTRLPMTEVALASGFNSLRRFNEVFQNLFHRPPTALRREVGKEHSATEDEIALQLSYQAPYDWDSILAFFAARALPGVEIVENNAYHRAIELDGFIGTIRVEHLPHRQAISAIIRFPAVRLLPRIVARIRRMFDLEANIRVINQHLSRDSKLAGVLAARPGLRVPGGWDSFEVAVRAVLGQQVSLAVARQLAGRLAASHGKQLSDRSKTHPALTCAFPTANDIAKAPSIHLGMPASRLRTLTALAQAAASDPLLFSPSGALEESLSRLMTMPGVGDWTAQYIALRAMRDTNAFPAGDLGLLRGAKKVFGHAVTPKELQKLSAAWSPWRAYAAQHLWAADGASRHFAHERTDRMLSHKFVDSPVGTLKLVASEKGLVAVLWEDDDPSRVPLEHSEQDDRHALLLEAAQQLREYFSGKRQNFSLPLDPRGTAFQRSVWEALLRIPFGDTRSYGELARQLGNPSACRAVGAANGRNPLSIVVPCHRVIGSNGKLTGFAGGLHTKKWLLNLESNTSELLK